MRTTAVPTAQDPSGSFDFARLADVHNTAYDNPLAWFLVGGWFVALAAGVVVLFVQRIDVTRRKDGWPARLFALAALLLVGPPLVSFVCDSIWQDGDKVPNAIGWAMGAKTKDTPAEFRDWAAARYGVKLTVPQLDTVLTRKPQGLFVSSNETDPIIVDGGLVHGLYAAGQIVLVDAKESELPVVHK